MIKIPGPYFYFSCFILLSAQSSSDILVSGGFDLIKTDNTKLIDKAQIGLEANYFVVRNFAAGRGFEWPSRKVFHYGRSLVCV